VKAQKQQAGAPSAPDPRLVVLVGEAPDWLPELKVLLSSEGYATGHVAQLGAVLPVLANGAVQALFLAAGPLAASDLLLLRSIRETSPGTAVVAVTKTPTDPDLKRAFESGATAFLSWPASHDAVRHAIDRSTPLTASGASRP
jgi:DNA-binding NtrC family response regulator